ncbi:MAG: adenosine kinase [Alphaproteobacteria bacterium]|nr:MAG: adenosine kinase [Alphaproteobacteria bacterium]
MKAKDLHVVGIGNAIVDVIARADDAFLLREGIEKGAMTLIDAMRAETLYERMGPTTQMSGGSAANTVAGIAALGGKAGFIGRVAADELGHVFTHDLRALGVVYATPPASGGLATARCLILVTPDAQRSMNTFLGASTELDAGDIDGALIARSEILYLEGYLWDPPAAKAAMAEAMALARRAGTKIAFTLSDAFCVGRYRDEFLGLLEGAVDILFANEAELMALFQTHDFDHALQSIRGRVPMAALTRSQKGAVILADGEFHVVDAVPVAHVVDSTGAGDLFAAGFLYGLTHGHAPYDCGHIGAVAAAEVIGHMGPRPEADLQALVKAALR